VLVHDPGDLTPVVTPGGALEALRELKEEGVVRAIGLGVRSHEFHRRLIETGDCEVSLTYGDYNLLDQSAAEGVLKTAASHDAGVFNGMAIGYGLLGGRDPLQVAERHSQADRVQRAHKLWEWTQSLDVSLLALALQFCLRETRISSTLVGAANPAEVEIDTAAVLEEIPEPVWQELPERLGR
jgi:aryl-alcohol dehydrogenase-like predicted oxidoreductase